MAGVEPTTELNPNFSSAGAAPSDWEKARERLAEAEIYWLTTVRPDGRPHVTPLVSVWLDGALYFCTGPEERKASNLAQTQDCIITTGCNTFENELDVVVEGRAVQVSDESRLERVAAGYAAKYDPPFNFTVRDGAFHGAGSRSLVFEVTPLKAFGFGRGGVFSQTRWRF